MIDFENLFLNEILHLQSSVVTKKLLSCNTSVGIEVLMLVGNYELIKAYVNNYGQGIYPLKYMIHKP